MAFCGNSAVAQTSSVRISGIIERLEGQTLFVKAMSDTLVVSQGVLMYVAAADQQDFYATCKSKGCKNFIFQEYATYTTKHGDKCLHLGSAYRRFLGEELSRWAAEAAPLCLELTQSNTRWKAPTAPSDRCSSPLPTPKFASNRVPEGMPLNRPLQRSVLLLFILWRFMHLDRGVIGQPVFRNEGDTHSPSCVGREHSTKITEV